MKIHTYFKEIISSLGVYCLLIISFLFLETESLYAQTTTTISSSGTFTVPAGVTSMQVYVYGAGGGSGGAVGGSNDNATGGGGGGACAVQTWTVSSGQTYTITIGAGGTAGAATGTAGGTGGTTTITGPAGTVTAAGGGGSPGVTGNGVAGAAGTGATTGSGFSTLFTGGNGTTGFRTTSSETGGGGGGGAGNAGNGANATGSLTATTGGAGGVGTPSNAAPYKGGAGASGVNTTGTLAGVAGSAPGGGAAGCATWSGTGAATGAVGGNGQVVLIYTPPCTTPSAPTSLVLTPGPGTVTGTFTAPGTPPSRYLVIRTTTSTPPSTPVLGTTYTAGTNALGGFIVSTNTTTGFTDNGLAFSTPYWYWIYSYNSGCGGTNPVYSTTSLNGTTTTSACTVATNTMALSTPGTYSWNTAALWSLGHVPFACENAVITVAGTTNGLVTVNLASNVAVNSLAITLNGAGTLANADYLLFNTNAFSLNLVGDLNLTHTSTGGGDHQLEFNINAGGSVICNNFNAIINGTPGNNGNVLDVNTFGTFQINGATLANAPGAGTANGQVQINVENLPASITFNGNAVFDNGTTAALNNIYVGTTAASGNTTGKMVFKANASFGPLAFGISGNLHGSTVFDGTGNQTLTVNNITSTMFFPSVIIGSANSPTVLLAGAGNGIISSLSGTPISFSVNNTATLDMATNTFNMSAAVASSFSVAAGAKLKLSGASGGQTGSNFPLNYSSYSLNSASTTEYYGATQTIFNGASYGNLTISTSGTKSATANLTIAGNLLINSPATFAAGTSLTHNIAGNFTHNGTFTQGTSTINLNGSAGQTVGGSTVTFYNLTVADAGNITLSVNENVANQLTLTSGKIITGANTLALTSATLVPISNANASRYVMGNLSILVPIGTNLTPKFEIGNAVYAPVTCTTTVATSTVTLTATAIQSTPPSTVPNENSPLTNSSGINNNARADHYWNIARTGTGTLSYAATFGLSSTTNGGTLANYKVRKYDAAWSNAGGTVAGSNVTSSSGLTTANGATSEFEVGTPNALPTINCSTPLSVNNNANNCNATITSVQLNGQVTTGGTPTPTVSFSPSAGSFNIGTTVVTATVSNINGSNTCSFNVVVNDIEVPVITCPGNISKNNDPGQCTAVTTFTATATDNCTPIVTCVPASGFAFPIGATTVNCSASDGTNSSTCSFSVTVTDNQLPVASCPANITSGMDAGQCYATVTFNVTASDNCPGATISCDHNSGDHFTVGTTTVNCTAQDVHSNSSACSFTVTVNDNQIPTVICPGNISVSNDPGVCNANVSYTTPTGSDNCSVASVVCVPPAGNFNAGSTTVTCTVTDVNSNTNACTFSVTVNDVEAPVIGACPSNISVNNDVGFCTAVVNYTAPGATDNCSATVSCSPASGFAFPVGTTLVTCTATDGGGIL